MGVLIIVLTSMTLAIAAFAAGLSLRAERKDQGVFLALFLGLYAVIKLDELYLLLGGYSVLPHLLGIAFPANLLLGPCIYFYARALMSPDVRWVSRSDWPALVAASLAILVATPFYVLPAADKIALMSPETRDPDVYAAAVVGCAINFALFLATSLAYLYRTQRLFRHHDRNLRDLFSRIDDKTLDWLRWVLLVLAVGWSGYAVVEFWAILSALPQSLRLGYELFEMLWIGGIAFFGVLQRPVATVPAPKSVAGSSSYSLDQTRMASIARRLDQVMTRDRLFEDPDLSLRDLSDATGVSANHLSETFSRQIGRNFFDYVNGYRISEARLLLQNTNRNVLQVALDTGFNSRSTFNAAFKKFVGKTPSAYRKSINPSPASVARAESRAAAE